MYDDTANESKHSYTILHQIKGQALRLGVHAPARVPASLLCRVFREQQRETESNRERQTETERKRERSRREQNQKAGRREKSHKNVVSATLHLHSETYAVRKSPPSIQLSNHRQTDVPSSKQGRFLPDLSAFSKRPPRRFLRLVPKASTSPHCRILKLPVPRSAHTFISIPRTLITPLLQHQTRPPMTSLRTTAVHTGINLFGAQHGKFSPAAAATNTLNPHSSGTRRSRRWPGRCATCWTSRSPQPRPSPIESWAASAAATPSWWPAYPRILSGPRWPYGGGGDDDNRRGVRWSLHMYNKLFISESSKTAVDRNQRSSRWPLTHHKLKGCLKIGRFEPPY